MHKETVAYMLDGKEYRLHVVYDKQRQTAMPCVLVAHAWRGQDDFARDKAAKLAELGYVGVALDIYGGACTAQTNEEAAELMMPLFFDRYELQKRMKAAFTTAKSLPLVESKAIGGIGFCFGGLAIIELLRSGADVRGVVSFHAVLGNEKEGKKAKTVPIAKGIQGSLLMLHGADDPLVTSEDIEHTQHEFEEAGVDWQMHIYGHTLHAFSVPQANDYPLGLVYNPRAEKRSWQSMKNFFSEIL